MFSLDVRIITPRPCKVRIVTPEELEEKKCIIAHIFCVKVVSISILYVLFKLLLRYVDTTTLQN